MVFVGKIGTLKIQYCFVIVSYSHLYFLKSFHITRDFSFKIKCLQSRDGVIYLYLNTFSRQRKYQFDPLLNMRHVIKGYFFC